MNGYSRLEYQNHLVGEVSLLILWECDRCGSLVSNQDQHNKWHVERIHD